MTLERLNLAALAATLIAMEVARPPGLGALELWLSVLMGITLLSMRCRRLDRVHRGWRRWRDSWRNGRSNFC